MALQVTAACRNLTLGVGAHQPGRVVAVPGWRQQSGARALLVLWRSAQVGFGIKRQF